MFGQLLALQSWVPVARRALIAFAGLALGPCALIILGMLAFMFVPVACVGIPFMMPAFFGGAVHEHEITVRQSRRPPVPAPLLASS